MNDFLTEEEQVDVIKKWWKDNGTSIVVAIGVAVAAIFGYNHWNTQKKLQAESTSAEYFIVQEMLENEKENDVGAIKRANELVAKNDSSILSMFVSLSLAKKYVDKEDYKSAEKHLNTALTLTQDGVVKPVIKFRLAQVNYAKGEFDKALSNLDAKAPKAYLVMIEELRGDVYYAKGDHEKAKQIYQAAYDSLEDNARNEKTLKTKLEDLGGKTS